MKNQSRLPNSWLVWQPFSFSLNADVATRPWRTPRLACRLSRTVMHPGVWKISCPASRRFCRPSTEQVNYSKMPLQIARAGFGISGAPGMILTRAPSRAPFALGVKITPGPQTCSRATIGLRPRRSWRTRRVDGARDVSKVLRPLHAVFVVGLRLVAAVVPPLGVNLAADNRNALVSALCGGYPAAQ